MSEALRHRTATRTRRARSVPQLDPRNNSLNLIRLVLAFLVLVSHSYPITGNSEGPMIAGESLGGWAVIGFFALSGYLITGSRVRGTFSRYLGSRVARIFPAFLVCLVVVAYGFAPIAYWIQHHSLGGFLTTPNTPANYVFANAGLHMGNYTVSGTLASTPYVGAWNGSLWTLWYEFACYLIIGVVAFLALHRSTISVTRLTVIVAALFAVSVVAHAKIDAVQRLFGGNGGNADVTWLLKLLPYFLGGALVYLLRERIPLIWPIALAATAATVGLVIWSNAWGGQLAAPFVTVVLLWVGRVVPSPTWFRVNDISYGLYIYAFPMQQFTCLVGIGRSVAANVAVSTVGATVLALASWYFLEHPILRTTRRGRDATTPIQVASTVRAAPDGTVNTELPATSPGS